jgi:hypothetical protein
LSPYPSASLGKTAPVACYYPPWWWWWIVISWFSSSCETTLTSVVAPPLFVHPPLIISKSLIYPLILITVIGALWHYYLQLFKLLMYSLNNLHNSFFAALTSSWSILFIISYYLNLQHDIILLMP